MSKFTIDSWFKRGTDKFSVMKRSQHTTEADDRDDNDDDEDVNLPVARRTLTDRRWTHVSSCDRPRCGNSYVQSTTSERASAVHTN